MTVELASGDIVVEPKNLAIHCFAELRPSITVLCAGRGYSSRVLQRLAEWARASEADHLRGFLIRKGDVKPRDRGMDRNPDLRLSYNETLFPPAIAGPIEDRAMREPVTNALDAR